MSLFNALTNSTLQGRSEQMPIATETSSPVAPAPETVAPNQIQNPQTPQGPSFLSRLFDALSKGNQPQGQPGTTTSNSTQTTQQPGQPQQPQKNYLIDTLNAQNKADQGGGYRASASNFYTGGK